MIPNGITLTVRPDESQFQLARRAFILIARLASLPPSEQLAFADAFVPLTWNNPSFQLAWAGNSDPSPTDGTAVKKSEFDRVRNAQVSFALTPEQKSYLSQRIKLTGLSGLTGTSLFGQTWPIGGQSLTSNGNGDADVSNVLVSEELKTALRLLEAEAVNFGSRFINDAGVRQNYLQQTKEVAEEILASFMRGEMNEREAANAAYNLRNGIMEAARLRTSDIGRALAEARKLNPEPLSFYEEKYAKKFFNNSFSELSETQRNRIWLEIVESSARPNAPVTAKTVKLNRLGKGLIVFSVGIAVYNIATSDDKAKATANEGVSVLGGIAGGATVGAAAGLVCGPGAPVCVTLGVFIGGIAGALAADYAFDSMW